MALNFGGWILIRFNPEVMVKPERASRACSLASLRPIAGTRPGARAEAERTSGGAESCLAIPKERAEGHVNAGRSWAATIGAASADPGSVAGTDLNVERYSTSCTSSARWRVCWQQTRTIGTCSRPSFTSRNGSGSPENQSHAADPSLNPTARALLRRLRRRRSGRAPQHPITIRHHCGCCLTQAGRLALLGAGGRRSGAGSRLAAEYEETSNKARACSKAHACLEDGNAMSGPFAAEGFEVGLYHRPGQRHVVGWPAGGGGASWLSDRAGITANS